MLEKWGHLRLRGVFFRALFLLEAVKVGGVYSVLGVLTWRAGWNKYWDFPLPRTRVRRSNR